MNDVSKKWDLENTRKSLDHDIEDVISNDEDGKYNEDRVKLVKGILQNNGVNTDDGQVDKSVRQFVEEGYTDWRDAEIDVVWHGSVSEVTPNTTENQNEVAGREISIRNPELVMRHGRDSESSGVVLPAPVKAAVGGGYYHVKQDENMYGYSRQPSTVDTEGWRYYKSQEES
jgi:hypothetical protein